jgi:hypothetical protein
MAFHCPYCEPVESDPQPPRQPISLRSVLIPSSCLRLGLPSSLFPSGFPTETLRTFLSSPMHATCSTHLIRFDLICLMVFGDEYKIWNSSLCNFLHSAVTSSLLGPHETQCLLRNTTHSLFPIISWQNHCVPSASLSASHYIYQWKPLLNIPKKYNRNYWYFLFTEEKKLDLHNYLAHAGVCVCTNLCACAQICARVHAWVGGCAQLSMLTRMYTACVDANFHQHLLWPTSWILRC